MRRSGLRAQWNRRLKRPISVPYVDHSHHSLDRGCGCTLWPGRDRGQRVLAPSGKRSGVSAWKTAWRRVQPDRPARRAGHRGDLSRKTLRHALRLHALPGCLPDRLDGDGQMGRRARPGRRQAQLRLRDRRSGARQAARCWATTSSAFSAPHRRHHRRAGRRAMR